MPVKPFEPQPPSLPVLEQLRMVLVGTSHPGNIGAAARAMKSMGLQHLSLVSPKRFPSADATARAAGADDLLQVAPVVTTLSEALGDCGWVAVTTARSRRLSVPVLTPRDWAEKAVEQARSMPIAVVFGRENWGLTNEEVDLGQALINVPTSVEFRSLNLASAVQIMAYEFRCAALKAANAPPPQTPTEQGERPATHEELEGFFAHLERTLVTIGYLDPQAPKHLMRRLRHLYNRQYLSRSEVNILRGTLATIDKRMAGLRSDARGEE